jgi:hypothetical protein
MICLAQFCTRFLTHTPSIIPLMHWIFMTACHHSHLQAMYARSSEFFGDIQHHTSVECSLRQLLDLAAQQQQQQQQQGLPADTDAAGVAGTPTPGAAQAAAAAAAAGGSADPSLPNLYLAQQSLQEPGG